MPDLEACRFCGRVVTIPEIAKLQEHLSCAALDNANLWQHDVTLFHSKFGIPIRIVPEIPAENRQILRLNLIMEEVSELQEAIRQYDIIGIADGIADAIYVILGTAIEYGINMTPVWDEVQRTNMAKVGGTVREDGKILKPEGWTPPDIAKILTAQGLVI